MWSPPVSPSLPALPGVGQDLTPTTVSLEPAPEPLSFGDFPPAGVSFITPTDVPHYPPIGVSLAAPVVSQHDLSPVGASPPPTVESTLSLKVENVSSPPGVDISPSVVQDSSPVDAAAPCMQENVTSDDVFIHLKDVVDESAGAAALAPEGKAFGDWADDLPPPDEQSTNPKTTDCQEPRFTDSRLKWHWPSHTRAEEYLEGVFRRINNHGRKTGSSEPAPVIEAGREALRQVCKQDIAVWQNSDFHAARGEFCNLKLFHN